MKFAYENLPDSLKMQCHWRVTVHQNYCLLITTAQFALRQVCGREQSTDCTYQNLARFALNTLTKAIEVITGSIPAVPKDGILIIESTAEGREGDFTTSLCRAKQLHDSSAELTVRDYKFHFLRGGTHLNTRCQPIASSLQTKTWFILSVLNQLSSNL